MLVTAYYIFIKYKKIYERYIYKTLIIYICQFSLLLEPILQSVTEFNTAKHFGYKIIKTNILLETNKSIHTNNKLCNIALQFLYKICNYRIHF